MGNGVMARSGPLEVLAMATTEGGNVGITPEGERWGEGDRAKRATRVPAMAVGGAKLGRGMSVALALL